MSQSAFIVALAPWGRKLPRTVAGIFVSSALRAVVSGRMLYKCFWAFSERLVKHKMQGSRLRWIALAIGLGALFDGRAQFPQIQQPHPQGKISGNTAQPDRPKAVSVVDLKTLPDTIGIEHQDRKNRFNRLAAMVGIHPPEVDEMQMDAGQVPGFNYPIPVVRLRFDERAFFDFDRDTIRPDSEKVLNVISENMKRDVPDAQLTILGHTDAIGSDAYNSELSRRRAASVMQGLIERGGNPGQMSTIAVGKTQPIAPNSTDEGRARNRRVEFMISASELANITLVSKRRIITEFLVVNPNDKQLNFEAPRLAVLKPVPRDPAKNRAPLQLSLIGTVQGKRPMPAAAVAELAPVPDPKLMPLKEFHQAQLNHEFEL